ncbi:hypothetical protein DH09_10165 [Bacillaceae bacterium JMAK1]|nr:hypothetical protein DH09_10165 [Bacillaceae bacterium JMAK1]
MLLTVIMLLVHLIPFETKAYSSYYDESESKIFNDVFDGDPHASAINTMKLKNIIFGYSDGYYYPNRTITRGQTATMMTRAFDLEVPEKVNEDLYRDVSSTHHFAPVVKAVSDAGIMIGRQGNTVFETSGTIHRQQMASILMRILDQAGVERAESDQKVTDLNQAFDVHRDNIQALQAHGITQTSDGSFRPQQPVTRAQMATFIKRTLEVRSTGEVGLQSMEMIDPRTVHAHFSKDIRGIDWESKDVRLASTIADTRILDAHTLELNVSNDLRFGAHYYLFLDNQRTTVFVERSGPEYRDIEIDIDGGKMKVSGQIPAVNEIELMEIILEGPDGYFNIADELHNLTIEGNQFKGTFLRVPPGDYNITIHSIYYGTIHLNTSVEDYRITYEYIDAMTDTILNKKDQKLEFRIDGIPYTVDEVKEEGYELHYELTDGYYADDETGMIDASNHQHLDSFSYKITASDDRGNEIVSDAQEVTIVDENVPVFMEAYFELDNEELGVVKLSHNGARLVLQPKNYFNRRLPTSITDHLIIAEVTSNQEHLAEYDLENGLIVHEYDERRHVTFEIKIGGVEDPVQLVSWVYGDE